MRVSAALIATFALYNLSPGTSVYDEFRLWSWLQCKRQERLYQNILDTDSTGNAH